MVVTLSGCHTKTSEKSVTIDNLSWRGIAEIQEYKTVEESGWELPDDAILLEAKQEVKSYKLVGYETKYRTEEYQEAIRYNPVTRRYIYETRTREVPYQEPITEPIYATKYYYTIDKWVHQKHVLLAEGYTKDYTVPEYKCQDHERISDIKYTYLVHFVFDGKDIAYVVDKEFWETLSIGHEIKVWEDEKYRLHIDWNITKI